MRLNAAVNEILSSFPYRDGNATNDGTPIVFRFLHRLWAANPDRRDARHREEQARLRQQELIEKREHHDERAADELLTVVLVSEEIRRAIDALSRDIADAIRATRIAHTHAVREHESAREALESARHNALVLSDGRRVYFTADGRLLYGEDHHEITDSSTIEQARRLHHANATSYETHIARWNGFAAAEARVHGLATALDQLDDLEHRAAVGLATQEDIVETRQRLDELLAGLPSEARHEYELIRARRVASAATEPTATHEMAHGFPVLPEITTEELEAAEIADREPAYTPMPKP